MSADKSFRGTLLLLQNKTKRDPEGYADEFRTQLNHFRAVCATLLTGPTATDSAAGSSGSNPQFLAVANFVSHVSYCFPKDCADLPELLVALLRQGKQSMDAETRASLVNNLILLRNKGLAKTDLTMPILFDLLETRDKTLRRAILSHIVSDVRRINLPGAKAGSSEANKGIQAFLFQIMQADDAVQARSALSVMIDLYRRQLWCDERTVQVISHACFSRHSRLIRMALHFFLMQMPKFTTVGSEDDEEELDPGRVISRLKHKKKHTTKTAKRERVLKHKVEKQKRRFDSDRREREAFEAQIVDPIRLLRDPQGFAERLLARLHKTSERFEVRILFMSVLARTISEHDLVVLGVFPLFERYIEPTQLHCTNILALASTCVHNMVPPDAVEPLIKNIANRFVNDRSDRDSITIGINTIREICKRQPLAMNSDLLTDLVSYKQRRGERGVIMAARALLQLYREVNPELLPPKLRGSKAGAPLSTLVAPRFGAPPPLRELPGLEALFGRDDDVARSDDVKSDTSSENIHITDSDSDSGEWVTGTDSDDEILLTEDDDDDQVPQLVPIASRKPAVDAVSTMVTRRRSKTPKAAESEVRERSKSNPRPSANGFVADDDMWDDDDEGEDERPQPVSKKHREEHPRTKPLSSEDDDDDDDESDDDDDDDSVEDVDEDLDSDDDSESDSGSGEWVDVSHSDEDESEDVDQPAALEPEEADAWAEDVRASKAKTGPGSTSIGAASGSVATMRTLTDEEFAKLRVLAGGGSVAHRQIKAKEREKQERVSRKDALVHNMGERGQIMDPATIETFTSRKSERDRERKIEEAQQRRMNNNPFQARKKKKTKLNTTHREKQKIGKLYQMTKRSHRVAEKIKRSVQERGEHAKDMKKKNIKFRIARGWKA